MRGRTAMAAVLALWLGVAVAVVATGGPGGRGGDDGDGFSLGQPTILLASLTPFGACDDLLAYVQQHALEQVTAYGLGGHGIVVDQLAAEASVGGAADSAAGASRAAAAPAAPGQGGDAFSGTNVQEAGVDEPDIVKTDGRILYTAVDDRIRAVDVSGATPRQVGELRLPDQPYGNELLLDGDRLLVLGSAFTDGGPGVPRPIEPGAGDARIGILPAGAPVATLTMVDVRDPSTMRVVESIRLDGHYLSARLVDGVARVVVRSEPNGLPFTFPEGGGIRAEEEALERNRRVIRESTAAQWLPFYVHTDAQGERRDGTLLECSSVHRPGAFSGFGTVSILSIDLGGGDLLPDGATAVLAGGEMISASADRLYVATTRWMEPIAVPGPGIPDETVVPPPVDEGGGTGSSGGGVSGSAGAPTSTDPAEVATLEPAAVPTLTPTAEPEPTDAPQPSFAPVPAPGPDDVTTEIHAFDITAPTARYVGSGSVRGTLLNQFSMSEHEGYLRVATTVGQAWWGRGGAQESQVVVLAEDGGDLRQVGGVGGLGRDERIHAVRFLGDIGYVVTFRETDPLYTVDLSDPTSPRVLGELKIPGYSAYLHPIGEGLVLGIGQDADEQGMRLGAQASLFDVSDLANPRRVATLPLGGEGASSDVEYDHRAFLWWPQRDLALVPVTRWRWDEQSKTEDIDSAVVGITASGTALTEAGRASHLDAPAATEDQRRNPEVAYRSGIRRSVIVGDALLTVSERGVLRSDLATFTPGGFAAFGG
jgi:hypothetical protein